MCLHVNKKSTKEVKTKLENCANGCILYKVMTKNGTSVIWEDYQYKPGINKSDRKYNCLCTTEKQEVNNGIHVFTTKEYANKYKLEDEIIVPVRCYYEDFIAAGNIGDAVFTQVTISSRTYRRYIKRK
jgi:hypothetical protein